MAHITKRLLVALLIGAAILLGASAHGHVPSARAAFLDSDGDGVNDEAELLFGSNPHDPATTPEVGGNLAPLFVHATGRCSDGSDNDRDGLIDSADPDCTDSDYDGISDSVEQTLGSNPLDNSSVPENARFDNILIALGLPVQLCNDGHDNDLDGLVDAADAGCNPIDSDGDGFDDITEKSLGSDWLDANSVPEHAAVNPGSCTDGIDNDHDGLTDGADPGCVTFTNDDVGDATVVKSLPFDNATKSLGATTESSEPRPDCALHAIEGTVWYSFTAPADMPVVIDTAGSDFATVVGVWTAGQSGYTQVACNNVFLVSLSKRFAFQATHGVTYKIQVGRNSLLYPGSGKLMIHLEAGVRPANDNFASATEITSLPYSSTVDIVAATVEPHEYASSCVSGSVLNTVWYRYTPPVDAYVLADTIGSDLSSSRLAVYQGTGPGNLTQVACSWSGELGFLAEAGQTYYVRAGVELFSDAAGNAGRTSAAGIFSSGTTIALNMRVFDVPSCPPPQFTMADRVGDQIVDSAQPDILSFSAAFTPDRLCVTMRLDRQQAPWDQANVDFDMDQHTSTGHRGQVENVCRRPPGLGVDAEALIEPEYGLLLLLSGSTARSEHALVLINGPIYTMIFPLSAVGGDDNLNFAVDVLGHGQSSDCAPDGGYVQCTSGSCAFSPFHNGDADCNGSPDAIDAALLLQSSAGLIASVACPDAADVNGDGRIDSLDAALVLQYSAGLLDQLPPEAPPPGPIPHPAG